ncbi:high-potential iron-sulfur protein [Arenibacter sp. S6351L]|uniref:high-potential iron-sulfur protein n=1 Tax=Arenibacter sp. S6351L TaxID=2926407 RepID=UPI001FF6E848|nr:high-potential iron-sulfur protein [Arenibacter sp. S6351L]MCK0133543.1 high-potential iron-sulfur protein [Arenibacter sp. S6351L]
MGIKNNSRRNFINKCFSSGGLFIGGMLLINCRGKNESPGDESETKIQGNLKDPCKDLTDVSDGEIKKRESLGYVKQSAVPNNSCGNCALYIPAKPDKKCGGCILFKGPVYVEGHCIQWAAITT